MKKRVFLLSIFVAFFPLLGWSASQIFQGNATGLIPSATLTTPNIGAATGTSLATTGAVGINAVSTFNAVSISHVGSNATGKTLNSGQSITFTTDCSYKLIEISLSAGQGAIVFASYASATLTFLANPDGTDFFDLTATPGDNVIGLSKSANSHVITVKNGSGGGASKNIQITVLGSPVSAITAP